MYAESMGLIDKGLNNGPCLVQEKGSRQKRVRLIKVKFNKRDQT